MPKDKQTSLFRQVMTFYWLNHIPSRKCNVSFLRKLYINIWPKIVSEYDQEIPQSQTADNPVTPRGRANCPECIKQVIVTSLHTFGAD